MALLTRKAVKVLCLILTWYVLSTGLSLYNKQTVGKDKGLFGKEAFPAPLLMSSIQFICQTGLAKIVFLLGMVQRTTNRRLPWSDYFRLVVPNGITTGLDIGFSNKSLVWIGLSFYTMCKSTVPVFLLFFSFIWGIEKPSSELISVVMVIVVGLALLVFGEKNKQDFSLLGFGLVMTASCLSGLRFTLTQVLLQGHQNSAALGGPLEVLEQLTPVMSITTLLFSLAWEELWNVLPNSVYFSTPEHTLLTLLAIALGALIAFLMVWTEYQVIKETSALSFMIAGTVKELVTVLVAVMLFKEERETFTWINCLGLVIVIIGVLLFNYHKYSKLKSVSTQPRKKTKQGEGGTYTAVEASEDSHGPDVEGKHLRRSYNSSGGGAASGGVNGNSIMPAPVSAAAAAAAAATAVTSSSMSSSPLATTHHPGSGLLARAIAGLLTRSPGGAGAAAAAAGSIELAPLLSAAGSGGVNDLPPGYRSLPMLNMPRDSDRVSGRGTDVEGMVIGIGNAGGDPAAAMALSGAGISGPQRTGRPGSRGLLTTVSTDSSVRESGTGGVAAPHHPQPMTTTQAQLPSSSAQQE